jgi:hypothetical protein
MPERRYREDEVREIFELATSRKALGAGSPTAADGLTLADIQSIGREVGLEPGLVARAAAILDTRLTRPMRRSWGMRIEVGRVVPLPRALSDREWERLVAELRSTFRARGQVTDHGGLREWANGNLHAQVEPTEDAYRLRLGTLKGDAAGVNALGATGVVAGAIVFGSIAASGGLPDAVLAPALIAASGIGAFLANLLRLPRWARQREAQMDHIADVVRSMIDAGPGDTTRGQ